MSAKRFTDKDNNKRRKPCKDLFRINSEVRGCDIILEKLSEDTQISQQGLFELIAKSLRRQ
jgi:hypothetical protein